MFLTCLEYRQVSNVGLCEQEQTSPFRILGEKKKMHFTFPHWRTFSSRWIGNLQIYWMTDFPGLIWKRITLRPMKKTSSTKRPLWWASLSPWTLDLNPPCLVRDFVPSFIPSFLSQHSLLYFFFISINKETFFSISH